MTIHATFYEGYGPSVLKAEDFDDWDELANTLEDMIADSVAQEKTELMAFAPHRLRAPYKVLSNVVEVTLMVLDVDKLDDLDALLVRAPTPSLVYESPSSEPDAPRVRVVAPISRPITVAECAHTRLAFAESLGLGPGCGAEGASDAAKLFFAGRISGTAPRKVWRK